MWRQNREVHYLKVHREKKKPPDVQSGQVRFSVDSRASVIVPVVLHVLLICVAPASYLQG